MGVKERVMASALSKIGRKGGKKTASLLTPEQRKEKARLAGIASGKVRAQKAAEKAKTDAAPVAKNAKKRGNGR